MDRYKWTNRRTENRGKGGGERVRRWKDRFGEQSLVATTLTPERRDIRKENGDSRGL